MFGSVLFLLLRLLDLLSPKLDQQSNHRLSLLLTKAGAVTTNDVDPSPTATNRRRNYFGPKVRIIIF